MQYQPFIRPFKRLYHLIGDKNDCLMVKQAYEKYADDKNFQFIISEEINFTYKPVEKSQPPSQGGVIKSYWLDKVLEKSPMIAVLVFNFSKPLDPLLEKWQDRLQILNIEANKAREYLRVNNVKKTTLMILVLTPNNVQAPLDKIKEYAKVNDRTLQIVELASLKNQIKRIKTTIWQSAWLKTMDDRIKRKSKEEGFKQQTKLRRFIKLAILKQICGSEDSSDYDNAYILCKQMHYSLQKGSLEDIQAYLAKVELRFLADVLLLKGLKYWYKTDQQQCMNKIKSHFFIFKYKGAGSYFYYQQMYWRSQLMGQIVNMLLGFGISGGVENKVGEIVKGIISYNIELSKIGVKIKAPQKDQLLDALNPEYYGRLNYKPKEEGKFKQDFKNTRISLLISKSQQFLQKTLALISQIRSTIKIKKHQEIYYTTSECRVYILQNNLQKSISIYNSIVDSFLQKNDFLVLNCLLKEFQVLLQKNQHHAELVKFYLVGIKISDYFNEHSLLQHFVKELEITTSELKGPITYEILRGSSLLQVKVDFQTITCLFSEKIKMNLVVKMNNVIKGLFKTMTIKFKKNLSEAKDLEIKQEQVVEIQPSDFLTSQDVIEIQEITFKGGNIIWALKGANITYLKKNRVYVVMSMNDPVVRIKPLFKKFYVNEAIPIEIKILSNNTDTKVGSKIIFSQDKTDQSVVCFQNPHQPINLIDTETFLKLTENVAHIFYFRFSKQGDRKVMTNFKTELTKTFLNSRGERKQVSRTKKYHEELKFVVESMLSVSKRLTIPNSELLTKKIEFKEGIYRVPIHESIMIQYSITAEENLILSEVKQAELDENIKFIKSVELKNVQLEEKVSYKIFSIIQVQNKNSSQLPPLLLKWKRKGQEIQNTFIDSKEQIDTKSKTLSIEFKEADMFRKGEVGTVHYRVSNHMQQKAKIRIQAMQTDQLLIVGKNKTELNMQQLSHCTFTLKMIPLSLGQIFLPELLIRIDEKLEAKLEKRHIVFAV